MERNRFHRNLRRIALAHVVVVLILSILPIIRQCGDKKKPHEIVTFIEMAAPEPEPVLTPVESLDLPEPEPAPAPEPKPAPPPPEPEPQPVKKKKIIQKSQKRIKRPTPDKPPAPKLSDEDIRKLLENKIEQTAARAPVNDPLPAWYYALVKQTLYEAWQQPSGNALPPGVSASVEIRVQRDGSIARRALTSPSGHAMMDRSVMTAVESVSRLRALPSSYPEAHKDITITFELTGTAP